MCPSTTGTRSSSSPSAPPSSGRLRALTPDRLRDPRVWRTEVLAGPVVALALVPEAISFSIIAGVDPAVGDRGALPSPLPVPGLPDVPFTLDTLTTITPHAFAVALVGLMESLTTATLVDDITDTRSDKTRESIGQGVASIVTGFFGGVGGCATIGQTMIDVRVSGARTRLSTFLAGAFLMVLCIAFGPLVSDIPMAALVAALVVVVVAFATFDRHSVAPRTLRRMPLGEITVMLTTVVCVVATDNPAIGVVVGSVTATVVFAKRVAHLTEVTAVTDPDATARRWPTGSPASCSSPPPTTSSASSTTPATRSAS